MRRTLLALFIPAAWLAASARPVLAQGSEFIRLGLAAGASRQAEALDQGQLYGGHGQLSLRVVPSYSAIGLRLDLMRHGFGNRETAWPCLMMSGCGEALSRADVNAFTLSGLYEVRRGALRPYVLAGGGIYERTVVTTPTLVGCPPGTACAARFLVPAPITENRRDLGASAGVGLAFPAGGRSVFLELRYHRTLAGERSWGMVPLTVGVEF